MIKHRISFGAVAVVATLLTSGCALARAPALVTVRNGTAQNIDSVSIEVSNQTVQAKEIPAGGSVTLNYSIGGESEFHVIAKFKSGRTVEKSVGYVDAGLNARDLIVVRDADIEFNVLQTR
jgi:hypothetical protein